jgi:hypothetical protein
VQGQIVHPGGPDSCPAGGNALTDPVEDAFGEEDEDELEPLVPVGLGSLTAPQRALADFLCLDSDLLEVVAETSAALLKVTGDARALATDVPARHRIRAAFDQLTTAI